ncbi:MAG: hypothetical protein WC026_13005 [Hyphomicrobium sp.]|uniref:hypothetical protein n=1 Tax=Hyphomicrobium sp. TaxID=82 RepID=UPI0035642425
MKSQSDYKDYIEKRVEIFPQPFKFGSFVRYEHCLTACEMAVNEAKKTFTKSLLTEIKAMTEHLTQDERNEYFDLKINAIEDFKTQSL